MEIKMILANDINGAIGYKNALPWGRNSNDMKWLKSIIKGHILVMGSKTWNSLPKQMNDCVHVVIGNKINNQNSCIVIGGKKDINDIMLELDNIQKEYKMPIMIFGGATIYNMFQPFASTIYLSTIQEECVADTYIDRDHILKDMRYCVYRNATHDDVIFEIYSTTEDDEVTENIDNFFNLSVDRKSDTQ